jgi:hypothetical protein
MIPAGAQVYYTGDMANRSGWFRIAGDFGPNQVTLEECAAEEPRTFRGVFRVAIGSVYAGHCDPRFVTREAFETYHQRREEEAHHG